MATWKAGLLGVAWMAAFVAATIAGLAAVIIGGTLLARWADPWGPAIAAGLAVAAPDWIYGLCRWGRE